MAQPKSILLFSDGTGNSSGKLFKTNVWRMYEALDLGANSEAGVRDQIAFYDNGVGTSSIRPLAMLGGILGVGLKRNLLELYRYLCRNYERGDRIYAFGFSRGAFTIRLLVTLVGERGVVRYDTEAELVARSLDEYRAFSRANNPDFIQRPAKIARGLRDGWIWLKRTVAGQKYRSKGVHRPYVEFVGVWDTVAAYGGPVAEVTRGINNWIWPLTPTNYSLGHKVRAARHALALDDERDSFHPLLWDEFHETLRVDRAERRAKLLGEAASATEDRDRRRRLHRLAGRCKKRASHYRNRLQQVWFAGMHSDVGGGYPDESLSFVSLTWMMNEARCAGVRLLRSHCTRIGKMANTFGPIHDSRSGFAAYYRYQPRKIAAYMHPESKPEDWSSRAKSRLVRETLSLRDPTMGEKTYRPQGYLMTCKVHQSVAARITSGTDDYAPISLPDGFVLAPLQGEKPRYAIGRWKNILRAGKIGKGKEISPRANRQEAIWDWVFLRRVAYFGTIALSLVLLALPIWRPESSVWGMTSLNAWLTSLLGEVAGGTLHAILPDFAQPWVRSLVEVPVLFLGLAILIMVAHRLGVRCERGVSDRTRNLWCDAMLRRPLAGPTDTWLRRRRNSYDYQRRLQNLKWRILPNVVGFALFMLLTYAGFGTTAQIALAFAESGYCRPSAGLEPVGDGVKLLFRTWEACNYTGVKVVKGHRYAIRFRVVDDWFDGTEPGGPGGISAHKIGPLGMRGLPGLPARRALWGKYLQPLYHVRGRVAAGDPAPVHLGELELTPLSIRNKEGIRHYHWGQFIAPADGELFLMANEAVLPWGVCILYANNKGTAEVEILGLGQAEPDLDPWLHRKVAPRVLQAAHPANAPNCVDPERRK